MANTVVVTYADADGLQTVEVDLDALPEDLSPSVAQAIAPFIDAPQPEATAEPVASSVPEQAADAPADATNQE